MSREQNQLPPIGPKPGKEPWGYDRKLDSQETTPEEMMDPNEMMAHLEQRFQLKIGTIVAKVDPDNPDENREYKITRLSKITVEFQDIRLGKALFIPTWAALHRLNHGIWKVMKQVDKVEE